MTQGAVRQIERARGASALLAAGIPVSDVVSKLGYFDEPHLARALRRYVGRTARQLREATGGAIGLDIDQPTTVEDDDGHGWTLLRHAIDVELDGHTQTGDPLRADLTAFLLARGADPLRRCNGMPVVEVAEIGGHWLAAEVMRAWIRHLA
jgi:hypothetical protein